MKRRLLALLSALTIMVVAIAGTGVFAVTAETVSNSEWFANAKYGISVSVKYSSQNNPESDASGGAQTSWENCVNEFDVDNFVGQVVQTGASYVLLCINQADEYFSAPNQAYADLIAASGMDVTDVMPTRDLPMEIMDALAEKGIKTMMYYAGDGPWKNEEIFEGVFGGEIDDKTGTPVLNPGGNDYVTKTIKKNWLAIMEEYAVRYGEKIAGWWLDGFDTSKYSLSEQKAIRAMLKECNSDALISFNTGDPWRAPGYNIYEEGEEGAEDAANILIDGSVDDYTAGEHHAFDSYPESQYVVDKNGDAKQWHILSYLCGDPYVDGYSGRTVMDADYMVEYVTAVAEKKGVVTMDVTVGRTGNILSNELNVLKAINKAIYGVADEPEVPVVPEEDDTVDNNYQIIQDYEGENNGSWGHAGFVDGAVNQTPTTKDPDSKQASMSGFGSFYSQIMQDSNSGSDFLIANAADMECKLENPTGIFFRLKTNRKADTTLYLSTIGAATDTVSQDLGWGGNNNADYSIMSSQHNELVTSARYYGLDGSYQTIAEDGRVVPAEFDGYVFIPFDVASKSLEGLTVMYAQSWALSGSYAGTIGNWYGTNPTTIVGFDNIGYYTGSTSEDHRAIIAEVESKYVSYEYEILQDYEGNNNGSWGHAGYVNGDVNQTPITTDPSATQSALSGFGSFSTQINGFDAGSDYLIADAADMQYSLKNPNGIFFRLKTNRDANTTMYVSTVGAATEADGTTHGWGANNNASYALMNYQSNNACLNTKYIALDGTDMTVDGDGRVVPANFDGYVFIPFDVTAKSLEGLTIMYAQSWALSGSYSGTIAGWYGGTPNVVSFDNVGYYTVANASGYKALIDAVEGRYTSYAYDIFQSYETAEEQVNAAAAGSTIVGGDGAGVTNGYVTEGQIGGTTSRKLYFIANNYGGDYLAMNAPASTLSKPVGIYVRVKTDAVKDLLFTLYPTTDKEGLSWPNSVQAVKYYNLDGELVYTSKYVMPASFDGYAFIPCGDVAGQAIAAQLLPTWYGNAYAADEMGNVGHAWVAGPGGGIPTIYFDNIGYYAAATDADFAAIIAELNDKYGVVLPDVEFDLFQGYETDEQRANAAAVGSHIGVPDSSMITNRFVTGNPLCGNVSRELYWDGENGSGADYLVMSAPASALEKTTGIYIRMKTDSTAITPLVLLPTTDTDGQISNWPHQSAVTAVKYYNLDGELVMTNSAVCPAGFDGYAFIPTGDIEGQAIGAMLMATWYGDAYSGLTTTAWWSSNAEGGRATIFFDDIGYYYTPNQDEEQYGKLIDKLLVPVEGADTGASFEVIQDYETKGSNANSGGAPFGHDAKWNADGAIYVYRATEEQAEAGLVRPLSGGNSYHTRLVTGVYGSDYLIKDLVAPTIDNADGIFLRLNTGINKSVSLCLSTAGADSVVNAETGELTSGFLNKDYELTRPDGSTMNTAVRYYSLDGELVGTGLAVPAGFDGYVFVPVDLSTKQLDGLTANWVDSWYGESEGRWHDSDIIVRVDNIGYYSVSNLGLDAEYAAIIDGVEGSYKSIDDMYRDYFGLIAEARGYDLTIGLGADLKADFDAAITNVPYGGKANSILYQYKLKVGTLGNPLRLNVGAAQIREDDSALRFVMEVDESFLTYMQGNYTDVEFGTLIARGDMYSGDLEYSDVVKGFSSNCATTIKRASAFSPENYAARNGESTLVHTCVIRNVPEDCQDVTLRARNYMKYTDGDTTYIVYGDEVTTTYAAILAASTAA